MPEALWPDDALPGQLPLFNRKAEVGVRSEEVSQYCRRCEAVVVRHFPGDLCFHCETLLAEFLANRRTRPNNLPPSEPVQEPDGRFPQRPPIDLITAAITYL